MTSKFKVAAASKEMNFETEVSIKLKV